MSLRPLRCVSENSVFGGIRVIRNGRTTIFIAKMSVLNVWNEPISRWSGRIVNVDAHNVAHVGCYQWHLRSCSLCHRPCAPGTFSPDAFRQVSLSRSVIGI